MNDFLDGVPSARTFELEIPAEATGAVDYIESYVAGIDVHWGLSDIGPGNFVTFVAVGQVAELDKLDERIEA
jgi:hypothetical protein